jgi:hypothetical protein
MRMPESVLSSGWNYQGRCGGWGFQEAQAESQGTHAPRHPSLFVPERW